MKLLFYLFFVSMAFNSIAQENRRSKEWENRMLDEKNIYDQNFKDSLSYLNYESIWMKTEHGRIFGIIGPNLQRIKMKFISIVKDSIDSSAYHVVGKSMVKKYICQFSGTITIDRIKVYKKMHWAIDDKYKLSGIRM